MRIAIGLMLVAASVLFSVVALRMTPLSPDEIDRHPNMAFMECGRCLKAAPFPGAPNGPSELSNPQGKAFYAAIKAADDALVINGKHIASEKRTIQ